MMAPRVQRTVMLVLKGLPDSDDECDRLIGSALYEYSVEIGVNGIDYGGDKHYVSNDGVEVSVLGMMVDDPTIRAAAREIDSVDKPLDLIPDDFQELESDDEGSINNLLWGANGTNG